MKSAAIKLIFACVALSVSSAVFALPDITGNWKCSGHNPILKKDVTSSGEIKKSGDVYSLVNWKDEGSTESRSGKAISNSKMKNSLAALFWSDSNAEDMGFGLYQVQSADKIVGRWTTKNGKVTAEEVCEKVKA